MQTFRFLLYLLTFFLPIFAFGQSITEQLFETYENFKEPTISTRRFKHKDLIPLLQQLQSPFEVQKVGESMEGRAIFLVKIGTGKTKVLLWSQMHGDESTATMAILDMFNLFSKNGALQDWKTDILSKLTIYFIPMLNPDGAERFKRRNALDIDLNRDALRLQTPEAQILKKIRDQTNAEWGFNLHDQSRYYSAGNTNKTATISFLAPAFNYEKDINEVRKKAMQQIGLMNKMLQQYIPGHVAKYNDDFEPRAFGDNIQKWGTSTILIESGGFKDDPEKQFIRKMNYIVLLTSFDQIANKSYEQTSLEEYESLPFNERNFHELIIRKATILKNDQPYTIDVGFQRNEIQDKEAPSFYYKSYIADLGDLSTFFGYEEFDAAGYTLIPGKLYPKTIKNWKHFNKLDLDQLHQQGYTSIRMKKDASVVIHQNLPINVISKKQAFNNSFSLNTNPSFFLVNEGGKKAVIINGNLIVFNN